MQVIGRDDLIRLKRAAGHGRDLVDVAALEAIRALRRAASVLIVVRRG